MMLCSLIWYRNMSFYVYCFYKMWVKVKKTTMILSNYFFCIFIGLINVWLCLEKLFKKMKLYVPLCICMLIC
uniref:Uncharacterized protein n=1 Tax=Anguilla anguilla TaxID=7936 RepID=A0A0E9WPR6_ANGAN